MVRINLAEFSIDTNSLDKAIVDNRSKIDALREALNNAKKANKDYSKEMQALSVLIVGQNKLQDELNRQLIANEISQEDYNASLLESNTIINQSNQRLSELSNLRRAEITDITDLERQIRTLSNENRSLERTYTGLTLAQSDLLENYDREGKSKQQLIEDNKRLRTIRDQLRLTTGEESAEVQRLNAIIDGNTNLINENADANETRIAGIGQYKEQIKSAFDDILNGNINQGFTSLQDSAKGLAVSIGNMTKQALAFVATPIGAVVTAVVGSAVAIGALVKESFDYNKAIQENVRLVENLFKISGKYADEVRNNITGIAETFGLEFKDVANTVDKLLDTGAVKTELEAINVIKNGLITAPDSNEYISNLESIAERAGRIGLQIEEVITLNKALEDSPVDGEAVFGALDKSTKALTEQSDKTRDALSSILGGAFTDDLLAKINNGTLTVTQALTQIDIQAKKSNLSVSETANLGATLFGKASVSAGGYANVLGLVNEAVSKQNEPLTELQKKTQDLADANLELSKTKDEAFKSDVILTFQKNIELFGVKASIVWYKVIGGIIDLIKYFDKVFGASELLGETWDAVKGYANSLFRAFESVKGILIDLARIFGINESTSGGFLKTIYQFISPLNLLKNLYKGLSLALNTFSNLVESSRANIGAFATTVKNVFSQLQNAVSNFDITNPLKSLKSFADLNVSKIYNDALAGEKKLADQRKKDKLVQDAISTIGDIANSSIDKTTKDPTKDKKSSSEKVEKSKEKKDDADKKLEEAQKKELELAKNLADEQIKLANAELQNYILTNASKLTDSKRLNKALIDEENKRLDTLKDKNDKINFDEYNNKKKLIELSKDDESLKAEQLLVLTKEYENKKLEISQSTDKQKKDNSLKLETQTVEDKKLIQAIEFEQQLARLEELGASEFEIQQSKLEQEKQLELQKLSETLQEKFQLKLDTDANNNITQQEIDDAKIELKKELDAENDLFEQERIKAQLDAINLLEVDYANKKLEIENIVNENKLQGRLQVLRGLSQIAGQETALGKAIATASVAYEQYKSISSIISNLGIANAKAVSASPLTFGQPWVGVNTVKAGIDIGASVAGGVKAIADINGASAISNIAGGVSTVIGGVKKIQGFADGGLINDGTSISRANGDDVLITAKKGEVILNENQQSLLGGANTFSRIGVPGFATGGLIGASNLQSVQSSISNNQNVAEVSENAILQITDAIYQGSQVGLRDLNTDLQISQGANF